MANNIFKRGITPLVLALVLCFNLVHIPVYAAEGGIPISDKIEITDEEDISLEGFNAFAIKQSTGTIIWVRNAADADNQDVIDAICKSDPSIKGYVVVSGDGTFYFRDYYTGNPYKNTYFTVDGNQLYVHGDYSHVSLFLYQLDPPAPEPEPEPYSDEIEIPDEDVPRADVPKTGDPMLIYAAVTVLSGLGLAGLTFRKKNEH